MKKREIKKVLKEHALWLESDGKKGQFAILINADLSRANLRDTNLGYVDFRNANLRGADLRSADLSCADLRGADLRYICLRGADLRYADLRGANLRGANLRGANLRAADLSGADLHWADLSGVLIDEFILISSECNKNLKRVPISENEGYWKKLLGHFFSTYREHSKGNKQ